MRVSNINVRNVPKDLHRKVKAEAALQGVPLQDLVIKILTEYLKKAKKGR